MVTHICSLKNTATIVQQEAGHFNMAHCCSCQKGSLTILHVRKRDARTLTTRALQWCQQELIIDNTDGLTNYNYIHT